MWVASARWMPRTSLKRIFCPSYRKYYGAIPYTGATINHATIVRSLVMTTGYVLADLATKVAYFSLTAVAFLFVWMLLTGIHP
jgi:hypothetical protein